MKRLTRLPLALLAATALFAGACSSGGDSTESNDKDTSEGAVSSVDDAKGAVVQIVAEGEFRDPEVGTVSGGGSGSGFIVDPSGIIVTNNHVVTGAGSIKVYVGGDDEDIPAQVLGVSECNDLAVIRLDDEGPWPYLEFASEVPSPPTDVYALGFPLGDPEYTATKGVISKAEADGESSWASVASVIEHDANIQPGNSGGPLVNEDGQAVGVNYATYSNEATSTEQFYAINSDLAQEVAKSLRDGDELSIGVNGTAIADEDSGIAGVWVNAVDAGGPASKAGVKPGDIITNLNGVQLDSGTMEEYCDVLRSASDDDAISIRVLRFDTEEELEGELFSDKTLEATYSFATELADDVTQSGGEDVPVSDYVVIADDTDRIATAVPGQWGDVDGSSQDLLGLGSPQPTLIAAPSIAAFNSDSGPGIVTVIADGVDPSPQNLSEVVDSFIQGAGCAEDSRDTFDNGSLAGPLALLDCSPNVGAVFAAQSVDLPGSIILWAGLAQTESDLAVLDEAVSALRVA
ncbi:MAG: S1C family serine protease [Microthrixaceae bacterium]|nr:serine protease [Microthrixaceae bacterium]MCO5319272.1 S1C family serine protease [Microthrixaceae bacterium]